ncbi:DNA-dependent metalloprotease SPRTN-like [Amblyomma americanum]|uniref:Protein with SprT-like domain at the N terminus n=2 Tax=Amblyomma americanum TaxID=6943 RepID=A0AAQ4E8N4_AMBAM
MSMASEDEDFLLSLQLALQITEEHEYHESLLKLNEPSIEKPAGTSVVSHSLRKDLSVVDEFWELHDPNPDVHRLFVEFNEAYFYGKLDHVAVCWSWRMTLCAGLCQYEGKGGLCTVKLSEPLLKLRPRKDLVETLLHEMIHAYLFVTNNNKDHNAHGPEFHKHMDRINKASGANITVFHNFHEEVDNYRTHWWRCNGPCQHRLPFFGIVKRAMNRPPSEKDPWWADHQRKCGGTFTKIREPDPKGSKGKRKDGTLPVKNAAKKPKLMDGADIRTLLIPPHSFKSAVSVPDSQGHQGTRPKHVSSFPGIMTKLPGNVHTLSHRASDMQQPQVAPYTGEGHTLGGCSTKSRLLEEGASRSVSIVESSCVLGGVSSQIHNFEANEATSGSSAVSRPGQSLNKCVTLTEVKPAPQKPSPLTQPTLKDFLGQKTQPAERTSRKSSAAKMKFIRDLLSSDSESDDDCVIIAADVTVKEQGKRSGKLDEASTSSSSLLTHTDVGATANVSAGNVLALIECPVCGQLMQEQFINSHLDMCLIQDD